MFVVFEPRCQEACGSSYYAAPEATITLSSISLSTRYNVDRPTPAVLNAAESRLHPTSSFFLVSTEITG